MNDRTVGLILLIVVGAILLYLPMILMGIHDHGVWRFDRGMMAYGRAPAFFFGFVIIILMAICAYLFLSNSRASIVHPKSRAIEILNERYAKGEITREDYLRMKEELGG